jgi:hypothetical protein
LVDYLDLRARLALLPERQLEVLLLFYVLRAPAEELAKRYHTEVGSIGGRISQARRALRKVLADLLPVSLRQPHRRESVRQAPGLVTDPAEERRAKVVRLLERRLGYSGPPDRNQCVEYGHGTGDRKKDDLQGSR